jgi:hypothetical protein
MSQRYALHGPQGARGVVRWKERQGRIGGHREGSNTTDDEGPPVHLLDDLIRPQQQRGRDREAERLGRFEVDDQLKFRGVLDR